MKMLLSSLQLLCYLLVVCCSFAHVVADAASRSAFSVPEVKFTFVFSDHAIAALGTSSSMSMPSSSESDGVVGALSDFVIVSTQNFSSGMNSAMSKTTKSLLSTYHATSSNHILYQPTMWQVVEEGSTHDTIPDVWGRFKANESQSFVCVIIATWDVQWNESSTDLSQIIAHIGSRIADSCDEEDVIMLAFTASVPDAVTLYLEEKATANESFVPLIMPDSMHLVTKQDSTSAAHLKPVANQVFMHLDDGMCVDAVDISQNTNAGGSLDSLMLDLCTGSACKRCQPRDGSNTNSTDPASSGVLDDSASSSNQDLLIVIICSCAFLIGSALLFYIFFWKLFFVPKKTGKTEKEGATHLAYVVLSV